MKPLVLSGRFAESDLSVLGQSGQCWRICNAAKSPRDARDAALIATDSDWAHADANGFRLAVSREPRPASISTEYVRLPTGFAELADGDVVGILPHAARIRLLYRRDSRHNFLLATERCNNYCLMCSQPPRTLDDGWLIDEIAQALSLIDPATATLTFTGGEPLTDWRRFTQLIGMTRDLLPDTAIHVLTNGRKFARTAVANAWSAISHSKLSVGIPIYAAVDHIHDYVVQARGAFDQTVLGVLQLKERSQVVEIRIVLHAITAPRLRETCSWIARNLPFVDHVALMGMENTGFAIANHNTLWIDPLDYQDQLAAGVDVLTSARINTSIYNLPLCVLNPAIRRYSVQSISDWKNDYADVCDGCSVRNECAGFFSTGRTQYSRGIARL